MSHVLLQSSGFARAAKRFVKKNPSSAMAIETALTQLAADVFHPSLKSHRLNGVLAGSWACSAGYDLRIIFSFVQHNKNEAILLENIGTHDEVY
jgi:mRNA-degrading endonuclease YafQ of YafQ-DinJ toxin-antitoxin module